MKICKFIGVITSNISAMRLTLLHILIVSCIISGFPLAQARGTRPIFGRCIDRELSAILKIIMMTQDRRIATNPTRAMEIDLKVDSVMRMIKQYLTGMESMPEISNSRSRKLFFWPFRPLFLGRGTGLSGSTEAGLSGSIYGGFGPDGFHVGGGVGGGLRGRWGRD